jgi:hypothetical protein
MTKSKKAVLFLGAALIALAITGGALAIYVYNMDFGVDYSERSRLSYNWKYYFAACPGKSHEYNGEFMSFLYPKFREDDRVLDLENMIASSDDRLLVSWGGAPSGDEKSELLAYFSPPMPERLPVPSPGLMFWMTGEASPGVNYSVTPLKITLKDGKSEVLTFDFKSHVERPDYKVIVGRLKDGKIFKMTHIVRINAFRGTQVDWSVKHLLRPERDAHSACVLDRFIKTLEIKK